MQASDASLPIVDRQSDHVGFLRVCGLFALACRS